MLVLHDVTELRRLESMRRDFVANVSHELKTPLTSIQAYADTLLEDDEQDAEQTRQFLEKIVEQGERLGALILDIIRLGKIESQPELSAARPIGVRPIVQACLDAHAAVAMTAGIDLRAENLDSDARVMAEATDLRTILDNLVDNALHYTPAGGTVTVRMLEQGPDDELMTIEVADTGIGIPPEKQRSIFEAFTQADASTTRKYGGTGLGLAIAAPLVQMMGGELEVNSVVGEGTTFFFAVPFERVADQGQRRGARQPERGLWHEPLDVEVVHQVAKPLQDSTQPVRAGLGQCIREDVEPDGSQELSQP